MNPDSAAAISKYLKTGGQVSKLPPAIAVTGREVVEYLISSGIAARCYAKIATTTYIYNDKPVTLRNSSRPRTDCGARRRFHLSQRESN